MKENKIYITTIYQMEMSDGEERKHTAQTVGTFNETDSPLNTILDMHAAKTGAVERKLLK